MSIFPSGCQHRPGAGWQLQCYCSPSLFHQGLLSPAELTLDGKSSAEWFTHNIAARWVEAEAGVSHDGRGTVSSSLPSVQLCEFLHTIPSPGVSLCHQNMCLSVGSQVVLVVENPPVNAGDLRDAGSIPGSGRSPGEGKGNPLRYSCLGKLMDRGPWWATVHGITKSWAQLKQLSTNMHTPHTYLVVQKNQIKMDQRPECHSQNCKILRRKYRARQRILKCGTSIMSNKRKKQIDCNQK